ncbi:MAG: hypothetical protein ACI4TB_09395 [Lachnospiraceae bacterium]
MKKALRLTAFILIASFVISGTYHIVSWKDTTGGYLSSTQQLYATDDNLMDVVFIGSSHCYCSMNPSVLWDYYGISAFDMAVSGQDKDSAYHVLIELLKTQSPQVVCIDMYALLYDEQAVLGNVYRNMLAMKPSVNSNALIQDYISEEEQQDYLLRWPIVHTRYRELTKYDFIQYEPSIYGRGFDANYVIAAVSPPADALACTDITELSEKNRQWLDALIALSQKEDFELVMFLAPFSLSEADQKIINGAKAYLAEANIDFLDFNRLAGEAGLDYNTDFCDSFHTNYWGAEKLTNYMGNYLRERYSFTDHRGDAAYHLWEECSIYNAHGLNTYHINAQPDLNAYLSTINECPDLTVIVSLDGSYMDSTLDLQGALEILGITEEAYNLGGKWVFEGGNQIFYMDNDATEIYTKDLSKTDTLRIRNIDTTSPNAGSTQEQLQINNVACGSCTSGLSIVVYDNFTGEIISQRGYY